MGDACDLCHIYGQFGWKWTTCHYMHKYTFPTVWQVSTSDRTNKQTNKQTNKPNQTNGQID